VDRISNLAAYLRRRPLIRGLGGFYDWLVLRVGLTALMATRASSARRRASAIVTAARIRAPPALVTSCAIADSPGGRPAGLPGRLVRRRKVPPTGFEPVISCMKGSETQNDGGRRSTRTASKCDTFQGVPHGFPEVAENAAGTFGP
jgi:hypothetical protein